MVRKGLLTQYTASDGGEDRNLLGKAWSVELCKFGHKGLMPDQGLGLDITELGDLLLDCEQNYSAYYIPDDFPEACRSSYCSVFGDHIPAFTMASGILGLLSNVALGTALAKSPHLWDQHRPGKTILSLMTVAAGIFAAILLVFAAGWGSGDVPCKAARAMQYGSLFAQGLLVAGSSCLLWGLHGNLLPAAFWAVGFLLSVPTAVISGSGDGTWAICILSPQLELYPWYIAHTILCVADFLLLPMLMGLAKVASKWHKGNCDLRVGLTWLFYLFWAPYGVAMILKTLVQEELLRPSCPFQEALDHFLGLSEGLGMLHCVLCPLFVLGAAVHRQKSARAGSC
uniref:atypical chemokine receptor 1 n=1 Tax=Euleptes europaea TaxID=460621 RepID=UPI002541B8C4|nr:atypical chemokine receptor 1 [Euleptes europaea]